MLFRVKLPTGLTCSQCVLQWKYRSGNNWGTEEGFSGLGYGFQEEFYNCADIAIGNLDFLFTTLKPTTTTTLVTTTTTATTTTATRTTTSISTTTYDYRDLRYIVCEVQEEWKYYDGMFEYCIRLCSDRNKDCKLKKMPIISQLITYFKLFLKVQLNFVNATV